MVDFNWTEWLKGDKNLPSTLASLLIGGVGAAIEGHAEGERFDQTFEEQQKQNERNALADYYQSYSNNLNQQNNQLLNATQLNPLAQWQARARAAMLADLVGQATPVTHSFDQATGMGSFSGGLFNRPFSSETQSYFSADARRQAEANDFTPYVDRIKNFSNPLDAAMQQSLGLSKYFGGGVNSAGQHIQGGSGSVGGTGTASMPSSVQAQHSPGQLMQRSPDTEQMPVVERSFERPQQAPEGQLGFLAGKIWDGTKWVLPMAGGMVAGLPGYAAGKGVQMLANRLAAPGAQTAAPAAPASFNPNVYGNTFGGQTPPTNTSRQLFGIPTDKFRPYGAVGGM